MISVQLVDSMGSDLSVVNAARVSFHKKVSEMSQSDEKLIAFLARENHWTPFGHATASIHVKAPIFVARQLGKHQVGLVWNEVSRRYVDSPPEFYFPENWRARNKDKKQGSHEDVFVENVTHRHILSFDINGNPFPEYTQTTHDLVKTAVSCSVNAYNLLLTAGVCPEQARMVLPQNMMTEWYWSGSLIAFARVCNLRLKKDTQLETRLVAQQISSILQPLFPISWKVLIDSNK
jgi:thymidylate synthase (FAD)